MSTKLSDIINIEKFDKVMQLYTKDTGMATAILDLDGNILSAAGWKRICTSFYRENEAACANCLKSDTQLANDLKAGKKFNIYRCMNGLVDVAVPIIINDQHFANLFIGQFLNKEPDLDFFKSQAAKYNFDETDFLEALNEVEIISEEQLRSKIDFLLSLTEVFGEFGQTKLILSETNKNLETKVTERTKQIKDAQLATLNMIQDVNEARVEAERLNDSLNDLNERLAESNNELEKFAYVSSHDLQEPLRKIKNYIGLLNLKYNDQLDENAQNYIRIVTSGADRMQQLISDLLQLSRITTRGKDFKPVNLNIVVNDIIEMFELKISEKSAEIKYDTLPTIVADEGQMLQLFQNLISNALKFQSNETPKVTITSKELKDTFLISVADNGIGIEKEYFDRIFEVFQRLHTRDQYPGTGIGLSVCKKIVDRHNGKIWVESIPQQGTTFFISLPKS